MYDFVEYDFELISLNRRGTIFKCATACSYRIFFTMLASNIYGDVGRHVTSDF